MPKAGSSSALVCRGASRIRAVAAGDWFLTHVLSMAAEKVTSLGKDWHRPCLRCEKCNKTLTSGGHAEGLAGEELRATRSNKPQV
ncbi:hypothetical protein IHE44_0014800 [Lamprotornis superbus]|uniref:LIM zinc-binding domain-containing protein n=1 Tax=Lamprotornis superbus TaxID=245042 RepID=A0A835TSR2_9PASS|nr:hypothetical protein IHE44_0014800 [Lamprotornis superbus]